MMLCPYREDVRKATEVPALPKRPLIFGNQQYFKSLRFH